MRLLFGSGLGKELAEDCELETNLLRAGWPYSVLSIQFHRLENRLPRWDWMPSEIAQTVQCIIGNL
jgi:hypothetical protein